MFGALGLVEVNGAAQAIQAADILLKTADVKYEGKNTRCGGHTTLFVSGDVAAVTEAVEKIANDTSLVAIKTAVISNPSEETERLVIEQKWGRS